jgi:hypothetical protein
MSEFSTITITEPRTIPTGTVLWVYVPARRALVQVTVTSTSVWYADVTDGKGKTKTVSTRQLVSDTLAGMLVEEKQAAIFPSLEAL